MTTKARGESLRHIVRKNGLENVVLMGKVEEKRSRGRQRLNFNCCMSKHVDLGKIELLPAIKNFCGKPWSPPFLFDRAPAILERMNKIIKIMKNNTHISF